MHRYQVGEVYHKGKTHWQEGSDFNYRSGALELRLFFSHLTGADIRAVKGGACSFAFTEIEGIIFFLFEFGRACPLSDNSYSIHLVPLHERTPAPELAPGEMALLSIILVSAEDGIIRALRQISLGHDFSKALYDAINAQYARPFDRTEHDRKIAAVYAVYPSSQALLARAQATCIVPAKASQN